MTDPKSLEGFFSQYMPGVKHVIEDYWQDNRQEAIDFLNDCIDFGVADSWMHPYFESMIHLAETAAHNYTNPWQVL